MFQHGLCKYALRVAGFSASEYFYPTVSTLRNNNVYLILPITDGMGFLSGLVDSGISLMFQTGCDMTYEI